MRLSRSAKVFIGIATVGVAVLPLILVVLLIAGMALPFIAQTVYFLLFVWPETPASALLKPTDRPLPAENTSGPSLPAEFP